MGSWLDAHLDLEWGRFNEVDRDVKFDPWEVKRLQIHDGLLISFEQVMTLPWPSGIGSV